MNLLNVFIVIIQIITLFNFIQLYIFKTDAFVLKNILIKKSITQCDSLQTKLALKINSDSDDKIKYTTDLYHLTNYDLTNIYTIIGPKTDIKTNNLVKRLGQINKKFVFIDKTLFEENDMNELILYFNNKQKINLKNIEQPWLFFEYEYILNDEVYRHLL